MKKVEEEEEGGRCARGNAASCYFRVSGCVDHFAWDEKEAYMYTRNIISTLNYELPEEEEEGGQGGRVEQPLHSPEELMGLAPLDYNHSLDVKLVRFHTHTHTYKHTHTQTLYNTPVCA